MKKRVLGLLLAVFMVSGTVLSPFGAPVVKATEATEVDMEGTGTYENFKYRVLENGTVEITDYTEISGVTEIIIPSEIGGNSVTSIGHEAFKDCSRLTSIELPSDITYIGYETFSGCSNLKDVYYGGTEEQWNKIMIDVGNEELTSATIYYNSVMPEESDSSSDNQEYNNSQTANTPAGNQNTDTTKNEIKTIALGNLSLSQTSITYNGNPQTPAVTVTDANGQPVDADNYTVDYSQNQNVGQATVSVTGKNTYTGTVTAIFNILPKGTKFAKVTAKKKAIAVKWKKQVR